MVKLSKEEVQKRVLYRGEPISMEEFTWDVDCSTFSSELDKLVFDFNYIHGVTFKTGNECIFDTDSGCAFNTGYGNTFKTGSNCIFDTGNYCTFDTNWNCTFNTDNSCTFNTGYECTFTTRNSCIFNTGSDCTFKTGDNCTFDTNWNCVFDTGDKCTFKTGYSCTFKTGDKCVIINRDTFEIIPVNKDTGTITLCPTEVPGYLIGDKYYIDGEQQDGKYIIADNILSKVIHQKGDN